VRYRSPIMLPAVIATCMLTAAVAFASTARVPRSLYVEHIGVHGGLPNAGVKSIVQDSQGFIWIATDGGVARYDGQKFTAYLHTPGKLNGLPNNWVNQISEGPHGNIWMATRNGLARWNRAKNDFTVYRNEPSNPHSLSGNDVRCIVIGSHGQVIVGTENAGIDVLTVKTGRFTRLEHNPTDPGSLSSNHVFTLLLDKQGDLWVGTAVGLDERPAGRHRFQHILFSKGTPDTRNSKSVWTIDQDTDGDIWVGTAGGGLDLLSPRGRLLKVFRHEDTQANSLSNNYVESLLEDKEGRLWVGTKQGLNLLNRTRGTFLHFHARPGYAHAIRNPATTAFYQDRNGLLWIGNQGGVDIWDPRSGNLGAHHPSRLTDGVVTSFAEDPTGRIWIASSTGLYRFNRGSDSFRSLGEIIHRPNILKHADIESLLYDRQGLWIGTMNRGLEHLSPNGTLSQITKELGSPNGLSANAILSILRARNGTLWVGTIGGGLDALNVKTGKVRQLPYGGRQAGALSGHTVTTLAQDSRGNLWIGTANDGLDLANEEGRVIAVYRNNPHRRHSLPANLILGITIDTRGRIWVATPDGLALVLGSSAAPENVHFKVYSRRQGLSSSFIYGVLSGARGNLWLSSSDGLIHLNPKTGATRTFYRENGAVGGDFGFGAYLKLRDGELLFGNIGGFNLFDPHRIRQNNRRPRLAVTNVRILGAPDPHVPAPWLAHTLHLNYRDSVVSLNVAVLSYLAPKKNILAYRISGITNKWIHIPEQQSITLTNLPPGEHLLEVRGANSDSIWSKPLRIRIYMRPKPWESPWAYSIYLVLTAILAIYVFRRIRMMKIRRETDRSKLEELVQSRTAELIHVNKQLEAISTTDSLTGLSNRRHFDSALTNEWLRCKRGRHSLALIMIDVDWFKQYNDTYGHQAGDACLRAVASELAAHARRGSDLAARYGGEEFVLLTPEADTNHLQLLAENIRLAIKKREIEHTKSPNGVVTVSIGVAAARPADGDDEEHLIRAADKALYRAKENGRNRVEVAE